MGFERETENMFDKKQFVDDKITNVLAYLRSETDELDFNHARFLFLWNDSFKFYVQQPIFKSCTFNYHIIRDSESSFKGTI